MATETMMRAPPGAKPVRVNGASRYLPGEDTMVLADDVEALKSLGWTVISERRSTGSTDALAKGAPMLGKIDATGDLRKTIDAISAMAADINRRLGHLEAQDALWRAPSPARVAS